MAIPKHLMEAKICNPDTCKLANTIPTKDDKSNMIAKLVVETADMQKEIERLSRTITDYEELLMQKNNIIDMAKEYLIEIRKSPSYELDERIDNLQEILDKEIK